MFTMSAGWEKVLIAFTYLAPGSSYLSPRAYGILHRLHHQNTDKPDDPHSPSHYPKRLFGPVLMMIETVRIYHAINMGKTDFEVGSKHFVIDSVIQKNLPYYPVFDRVAQTWALRLVWIVLYTLVYVAFAPSLWWFILIPIHYVMTSVHGLIINWYAHTIGYRSYDAENTSTNLFPIDPMAGEGLHNNHHQFPGRANFANRWYEFDLTYQVIKVLAWMRIIKLRTTTA